VDDHSNMYDEAKTWNPFKGCAFKCVYCTPSFQRQSKCQRRLCLNCYTYTPHCHEDRLSKIPSAQIIFVCGNADISFCPPDFTQRIIERIVEHNGRAPHKTYYLQSKRPAYFEPFLAALPNNVILLTTLETNRDDGYDAISRAPPPSVRCEQFKLLDYRVRHGESAVYEGIKRGIGVYYTALNWGGISFAIIEDRKFKTGPEGVVPKMGPRPDHVTDPDC